MPTRSRISLRILLWLLLGGWLGAMLLFGGGVARATFATVPDPSLAASLVGLVLGRLERSGMVLALVLAALGGALGRGRTVVVLPLLIGALCAINHFAVSPTVAAIDLTAPDLPAGAGVRFARLHRLSVWLFAATAIGASALAALHAFHELRREGADQR
jgi:hypothetical protein